MTLDKILLVETLIESWPFLVFIISPFTPMMSPESYFENKTLSSSDKGF
jgi:hypothetical protein